MVSLQYFVSLYSAHGTYGHDGVCCELCFILLHKNDSYNDSSVKIFLLVILMEKTLRVGHPLEMELPKMETHFTQLVYDLITIEIGCEIKENLVYKNHLSLL